MALRVGLAAVAGRLIARIGLANVRRERNKISVGVAVGDELKVVDLLVAAECWIR